MKKAAVLCVLAALAALGAVLVMSGVVYVVASDSLPTGPGQASAHAEVTAPGNPVITDGPHGGSEAIANALMASGSSGDASSTANASTGVDSAAGAIALSSIDDNSSGTANATANAAATNGGEAIAGALSYIGSTSDPNVNSVANATATNGGYAEADAIAGVGDGASGNNTAYAYANSTGADALSVTDIETGAGAATPAPGFYYDIYVSGDSFAWAWLFVPGPSNIVGFTYTNAGSTNAFAGVGVNGSDITVIANGVLPPQ